MGMTCSACGEANRGTARFCFACGNRLAARCGTCDSELVHGARFCDECGAPTAETGEASPAATDSARKTVTVVFADLHGSTALQERMDPESARSAMSRFYGAMRDVIDAHGGRVVKFVGDGVMAVFGVPEVAEDDAARAVAAAAALVEAGHALGMELELRVGVNTGEVVVAADDADVIGDVVNIAARLESAAPLGRVLVGATTWRLTRDHASFGDAQRLAVKGRTEPVTAFQLVDVQTQTSTTGAPFVGREVERHQLEAVFDHAVRSANAQLVTVIGSPGVGKSRLLHEFVTGLQSRATVLTARCDATGGTYAPMVDIVRSAADAAGGLDALVAGDPDRSRLSAAIAELLEHGRASSPEETFWTARRALMGLVSSTAQPIVIVLDDVHWAESLLLDLVEHLAEWLRTAPLLLVIAARPELRELRPSLVEPGGYAALALALDGLDDVATTRLARDLLGAGAGALPVMVMARVVEATGGNPLFVRELVRMLVDDGVLRQDDGSGWQLMVDVDGIEVPPTISALLEARVDRLRVDERLVLERAAVIGPDVYRGLLAELLPTPVRRDLAATLESLRRKELLEPAGAYWGDEPVLRFHHALIRDAAYRRLLKEARAELHEQVASWLAGKAGGGSVADYDELVGFHLEQAFHNRAALGGIDDATRVLASVASLHLGRAGRQALDHDDLHAAAALTERALACLEDDDPARGDLLIDHCEALLGTGKVSAASPAIDALATLGTASPRLDAWATSFDAQRTTLRGGTVVGLGDQLGEAAEALQAIGDMTGAAKAHRVHASVLARLGQVGECEVALDRSLAAAREARNNRQITNVLAAAPVAALWGPSPVLRAGGRCLDVVRVLRITTRAPEVEAISYRCQAVLEALRGRSDAARTLLSSSRTVLEDLGGGVALLELDVACGIVECYAGEWEAAEGYLGRAITGFRGLGANADAYRASSIRARVALAAGDDNRALELAEECGDAQEDLTTAVGAWSVKALVLARRGRADEALQLVRDAVDLAAPTDALVDHADAMAALAEVLAITGDDVGAGDARRRAYELYEQKGATALFERVADGSMTELSVSTRAPASESPLANEMTRFNEETVSSLMNGTADLDVLVADYTYEDRRAGLEVEPVSGDETRAQLELIIELGIESVEHDVIAIRGEHCALVKSSFHVAGTLVEPLAVMSKNPNGGGNRTIMFDTDAMVDALEELNRQYLEGEAQGNEVLRLLLGMSEAFNRREWDAFDELYAPDVVSVDHRRAPYGTTVGANAMVERHRTLPELHPGAQNIMRQLWLLEDDVAIALDSQATDFVLDRWLVARQRDGRIVRMDFFEGDDLAAAERLVRSWRSSDV
jgi:class 3 adenylate cyclase/tetratricopeptide (TPR) repeat protein